MTTAHELFARQGVLVVGLHTVLEHHAAITTTSLRASLLENRIRFPMGVDMLTDDGGPAPLILAHPEGLPALRPFCAPPALVEHEPFRVLGRLQLLRRWGLLKTRGVYGLLPSAQVF